MILKHSQGTYQSPSVRLYVHLARIFGEYYHKNILCNLLTELLL